MFGKHVRISLECDVCRCNRLILCATSGSIRVRLCDWYSKCRGGSSWGALHSDMPTSALFGSLAARPKDVFSCACAPRGRNLLGERLGRAILSPAGVSRHLCMALSDLGVVAEFWRGVGDRPRKPGRGPLQVHICGLHTHTHRQPNTSLKAMCQKC